jgi:hypothetical protein
MDVRFCEGRNHRPTIFTLMCQEKRDRRSLSVDGAHSQFSDGDSYPDCGGQKSPVKRGLREHLYPTVLGVCGCA